jgi:2-octaprenyl-6-methoxyphenol hydroxylase
MSAPTSPLRYDIAVIGGGIVGTLTACLLKNTGLKIALIEAESRSEASDRGQAYSINLLSSQIFQGLGLWQRIRPNVETYSQVQLSDGDYGKVVHFSPKDVKSDLAVDIATGDRTLGYVAEHRVLLAELQDLLKRSSDSIHWFCPAKVIGIDWQKEGANLTIETEGAVQSLSVGLVIGADGARSAVRSFAGIKTTGWQYWQSCVVAMIRPELFHAQTAYEKFQPEGPFAILPLPENFCRIVWTARREDTDDILSLSKAAFLQEVKARYGDQMGDLELVGEPSVFPVKLLHSWRYVGQGVALVGDAAHCCHPVGGQGINLGIRDAAALAEVIGAAVARGADWTALGVLKRYDRWRRWENLVILGFTDLLDRVFSNQILPIVWVRRLGLWGLAHVPILRRLALLLMLGLLGRHPRVVAAAKPQAKQWIEQAVEQVL